MAIECVTCSARLTPKDLADNDYWEASWWCRLFHVTAETPTSDDYPDEEPADAPPTD